MISTKTRSIKTSKALIDHFEKESKKKGFSFNARVVHLMHRDSKFEAMNRDLLKKAVDKFSSLNVPKSKRMAYKTIAKPLKALVKDLL